MKGYMCFFYDSIQNHNVQLQALFDTDDGWNKKADKKEEKIWFLYYLDIKS